MTAALGALALLLAALLPESLPRGPLARRGLAALGALSLVPWVEASGTWPAVALCVAAVALATPLVLVLAAAGAVLAGLHPGGSGPLALTLVALALVAVAEGLESARREPRAGAGDASRALLVAGLLLVLVLALLDGGAVLSWTFGVGAGADRVLLRGVGTALGVALLAAVGGILFLGGAILVPPAPGPRRVGRGALFVAAAIAAARTAWALVRLSGLPEGLREAGARPLAILVGVVGILAVLLLEADVTRPEDSGSRASAGTAFRVAAALAVAAAVAAGLEGWWRGGTYATGLTAASGTAALLGLAAREPLPRLEMLPRLLFAGALLFLLLA